jgi:hypothetical protein
MIDTINHQPCAGTIFTCKKKNFAGCKKNRTFANFLRIMNQNLN